MRAHIRTEYSEMNFHSKWTYHRLQYQECLLIKMPLSLSPRPEHIPLVVLMAHLI